MKERFVRSCVFGGLLSTSIVATTGVFAAGTDSAAAQALFDQAKKLMVEGKYAEACPKLEESQQLDAGFGTLLNLADCYEKQGRLASAWSKFLEASAAARAAGRTDAAQVAKQRAAALAPRLSNMIINVDAANPSNVEVSRDGVPVGKAQWGAPIPVDQGSHAIRAIAPGRKLWEKSVVVQGTSGASNVTVAIPALEPLPAGAAASAPAAEPPPASPVPTTQPGPQSATAFTTSSTSDDATAAKGPGLGAQRTAAVVVGAVGVAGVALGAGAGIQSKSLHDQSLTHCNGAVCSDVDGYNAKIDAREWGNISTVSFIVGVGALAGAAALWITAKPSSSTSTSASLGIGPGNLILKGTW